MRQQKMGLLLIPLIVGVCAFSLFFIFYNRPEPQFPPGGDVIVPIVGRYVFVANPAFSEYPVPGMVYAISNPSGEIIYLTNASLGGLDNLLWSNEPNILINSNVMALGELWYRDDVAGRRVTLLEYNYIEAML